jgi:hypothetical protein
MKHVYILSLIDAHLDSLAKARQILATLETSPKRTQGRAPRPLAGSKTLGGVEKKKPSALPIAGQEISPRKKTAPATMVQRPSVKERATAALAKLPEAVALDVAHVPDAQIRPDLHQEQYEEQGARAASKRGLGETTLLQAVARVPIRRKRFAPNKPSSEPLARALGGPVPALPIFIPAEQISQERSQRNVAPVSDGSPSRSTVAVPLTAELLARRWVQGLAS